MSNHQGGGPMNNPLEFQRQFLSGWETAAVVPAIRLTRNDWNAISFIVREMAALSQDFEATDLSRTLIQGAAIQEAVLRAKSLLPIVEMNNEDKPEGPDAP